jgi:beta-glucosidase
VSERALHEIYLPAFEAAIHDGNRRTIMASYNRINGHWAAANRYLLTTVLRDRWNFDGLAMSDWGAVHETVGVLMAGLDLEMPGPPGHATGRAPGPPPEVQFDLVPYHGMSVRNLSKLARASEYDGALTATFCAGRDLAGPPLLTRQDKAIDLRWRGRPALEVPHDNFCARWTGKLTPKATGPALFVVSSDDGSRVKLDGRTIIDAWSDHSAHAITQSEPLTAGRTYDLTVEYYQVGGDAVLQFGYAPATPLMSAEERQLLAAADAAIVLAHTFDSEGEDHAYDLPPDQERLIAAAANPRTAVVLESGADVNMEGWIYYVPALVDAWFPGQSGARVVAQIVFGDVNPSGHLPDTFGVDWANSPAYGNYPGAGGKEDYAEGIYVGYRGIDRKGTAPRFPCGFGLSYTTFDIAHPRVTPAGDNDGRTFTVTVDVTNTGKRAGATVAQLYVRTPAGEPVERPVQELKGFARVELQPGETKAVTMTLDRRRFASWDQSAHDWAVVPGTYGLAIGRSSRDVSCTASVGWK